MIVRNATREDMERALAAVNATRVQNQGYYGLAETYSGNVRFKRLDRDGSGFTFTLTVKSSRGPGARRSHSGRRIAAACWHVHGRFFEELFKVAPGARVFSSFYRRFGGNFSGWITAEGGNWMDGNIGSQFQPMRMSEACECR